MKMTALKDQNLRGHKTPLYLDLGLLPRRNYNSQSTTTYNTPDKL
jgi:hypothetical protein